MTLSWKEIFQKIAGIENMLSKPTIACKVLSINGSEVKVEPLRESAVIPDARLKVDTRNENGITIVPKLNSLVFVSFSDMRTPYISLYSEIEDVKYKISGKYDFANNSEQLGKILKDLCVALEKLTVTTSTGPSGTPINLAEITAIKNRISILLTT